MGNPEREATVVASSGNPPLDLVFDLLADRRRRYALYYLSGLEDGVATAAEIARHVVDFEEQVEGPTASETAVETSLQHVHLPRMEEAGVLELDRRTDTVRYRGRASLEEWLEHARHKELS